MSRTVLIVDDSPVIRRRVSELLGASGYQVLEAKDGVEGVDVVAANPLLAMVIADINMPCMNGLEMLAVIRGRSDELPVLMLTTEGNPQVMQHAKSAGATAWILKPFKNEHLLEVVKKIAGAA